MNRALAAVVALAVVAAVAIGVIAARRDAGPTGPRIASLSPAATEVLRELGAVDAIVARSEFDARWPDLATIPGAGSAASPDLGALQSLQPTHILVDDEGTPSRLLERFDNVVHLSFATSTDAAWSIETLGTILDRERRASALAERYRDLDRVKAPRSGPLALVTLGVDDFDKGALPIVTESQVLGRALMAQGIRLAAGDDRDARIGVSTVLEADPDVILVLTNDAVLSDAARAHHIAAFDELAKLPAVSEGRVDAFAEPSLRDQGPGVLAAATRIATKIRKVAEGE